MMMGVVAVLGLASATVASPALVAAPPEKTEDVAGRRADAWLDLVDQGKYDQSWEEAARLFKGAVTKEKWREAARSVRAPLGKLVSRKVKSRQYTTDLPRAPQGEYVVIQYDSSFENKKEAVETVTPMLDPEGIWRVSGYFIR